MKKIFLWIGIIPVFFISSLLIAGGNTDPSTIEIKTTRDLKQYMYKFGSLVAGLEILRAKEKNPDWSAIEITLKEMSQNIEALQRADKKNTYKSFTDQLSAQVITLKRMNDKKDSRIYDGFDKLTNTCFQCHAVHRPADFLKPNENQRLSHQ